MPKLDLTVLAIPAFIGAMGAEYAWLRRHPPAPGTTRAGDYTLADTLASLSMGVGSLLAPHIAKRLLDPITPGVGRWGKALLGTAAAGALVTTVADVVRVRYAAGGLPAAGVRPDPGTPAGSVSATPAETPAAQGSAAASGATAGSGPAADPAAPARLAAISPNSIVPQRLTGAAAVAAVGATALTVATTWAAQTSAKRLFENHSRDLGSGALGTLLAIAGWDFIYYWNHRLSHESRWLWAVHVVHHSSEHYNLSTALRQPVAEGVTWTVPYGLLALIGIRPSAIENARALNLIYQFWIHTEVVRSIGWLERVLNTPSHHRVHHGSNRRYLDRNHGSILIIWDRIFGTFEPEGQPVVYGLTRNIDTHNPARIASHEWRDITRDIAGSRTWSDRFGYLLRGPGWAYSRRAAAAV